MNTKQSVFEKVRNGLIVSCQAEGTSPFNSPDGVVMLANAVIQGGAVGIRSEGIEKTKKIINEVNVPVIGLIKTYFEDGYVRITGSVCDVENLIHTGCDIIAIDGTFRKREGLAGPEFIKKIKNDYKCIIMADIATYEEGVDCAMAGADCISTTLNGYTSETKEYKSLGPNYHLVELLSGKLEIPVFAEGRINTPDAAARMINSGAWSVVTGSAITRPTLITQWYIEAINKVVCQ